MPLTRGHESASARLEPSLPSHCSGAQAQTAVERPPQFVLMAFDNCTELERWQEWSDFAAGMNRDRDRVHFTFFVSGVNFIANAHRGVYEGPRQRRGAASINFGGTPEDVRRRVDYINALQAQSATRSPRTRSAISTAPAGRRRNGPRNSVPSTTRRPKSGPTTVLAMR